MDTTSDSASTLHHSSQHGTLDGVRWSLTVVHHARGELIGRSVTLPPSEPVELGRKFAGFGAGALDDHRVSRRHAQARVRRDGPVELEDLGSQNGSFVNGARLDSAALLATGDIVRLGSILLLVTHGPDQPRPFERGSFVGMSPSLAAIAARFDGLAADRGPLLVCGDSGTGKAHLARALHEAGHQAGALVHVNCASIPDRLVAHELFGYERGAFPGADAARAGLIASADNGTIVFDELGDASSTLQGALVHYLDSKEIRRVGSDHPIAIDARVIVTGTHDANSPTMRADLRTRLAGEVITLLPLRDRIEDAAFLAARWVREALGADASLHWRAALALLRYSWPGNLRQLAQIIQRLVAEADAGATVRMSEDVETLLRAPAADSPRPAPPDPDAIELPPRRLSKQKLRDLLREHAGNVTAIASHLGVGRNTLYRWLKLADLDVDDFRR